MEKGMQKAQQWIHTGLVEILIWNKIWKDKLLNISPEFFPIPLPTTVTGHSFTTPWAKLTFDANENKRGEYVSTIWLSRSLWTVTRFTTYHQKQRATVWKQICCLKLISSFITSAHFMWNVQIIHFYHLAHQKFLYCFHIACSCQ